MALWLSGLVALRLRDLVALRGEGEEGGGREEEGGGKEEERGGREDEGGGARDEGGGRRKEGGGTRERGGGRKKEGGISEPEALTRFVGGPKSRVCRQARKGSQNTRFGAILMHFGAAGAHRPFWRSKVTSLQAGPERASEQLIWGDLKTF